MCAVKSNRTKNSMRNYKVVTSFIFLDQLILIIILSSDFWINKKKPTSVILLKVIWMIKIVF